MPEENHKLFTPELEQSEIESALSMTDDELCLLMRTGLGVKILRQALVSHLKVLIDERN